MNVVFFGSSKFVIPIIEVLQKNFDLALVVTTEKLPTDPVSSYCIKSKVCYYVVTDFRQKDVFDKLKEQHPDIAILASFGAIVSKSVLDIFKYGVLNIHPSLLPKYRGPTPVQTAILKGDKTTGVTIIKLDEQVDHGPILAQKKEAILENDTAESLYERLFKLSSGLIVQTIKLYLKEIFQLREQNHPKATFTKMLTRQDGYFDINNPPKPEILDRMIRAYYPWPGAWTQIRINDKARLPDGQGLRIKFLPENRIQVEGKKPMSYKDFVNGYPEAAKNLELIIQN